MAKRAIPILLTVLLLLCLLGVMSLLNIGASTMKRVPVPTQDQIFSDGTVPPAGSCEDVGKKIAEDPFSGWPVRYRKNDWNTISTWFCDPTYKNRTTGKWVMHSGIDIATYWCEVGECQTVGIGGHDVIVTTDRAIVREVKRDCPSVPWNQGGSPLQKCGYPMGNHVILEALKEVRICEPDPLSHTVVCHTDWIPSGWIATYMHLDKVENLYVGQELVGSDKIGEVGNTGNSSGAHLHYQINRSPGDGGKAVDPAPTMALSYADSLRTRGPHYRP